MNVVEVWLNLSTQKKLISSLSVLATIAALFFLGSSTLKPETDLLYSGLDPAAAGEIIAKLETMDVAYEVRGGAIYADRSRRDSLRLELARDGLPRQNNAGYEIFDDMNSFAMTSDMFDTAYWRAKEGELARTLLAMPNLRTARVHLGTQKTKGFSASPSAHSASVTLSSNGGVTLQQAKAIQYLIALSVSGLNPGDVAVIDTVNGVIVGPGMEGDATTTASGEIERAAAIKSNLISLLEARVGRGNARVNVSLDIDRTHITTAERQFDPETRVVRSQTSNETTDSSRGTNGAVTVASNLPEGDAGGGNTTSDRSESSESVTYEISEIVKNTEILPGNVKRMTVAVLISDITSRNEDGTVTREARSVEELEDLRELVAAASGLDDARGDKLTLRSLSFDQPAVVDPVSRPSVIVQFLDRYLWSSVQAAFLGIVALLLGIFVIRPLLTQRPIEPSPELLPMSLDNTYLSDDTPDLGAISTESDTDVLRIEDKSTQSTDPIEQLKSLASEQSSEAADLLTSWLEQDQRAEA